MKKIVVGETYGNWTVLRRCPVGKRVKYLCKCICNREIEVLAQNIGTRSTQCRPCASQLCTRRRNHLVYIPQKLYGRLYHQARGAIRRCNDSSSQQYHNYGGRGITVYLNWLKDIKIFIEYLATLPEYDSPLLVLDRIDNDGNYEPGNLRFTTWSKSGYNRRLPSRRGVV